MPGNVKSDIHIILKINKNMILNYGIKNAEMKFSIDWVHDIGVP